MGGQWFDKLPDCGTYMASTVSRMQDAACFGQSTTYTAALNCFNAIASVSLQLSTSPIAFMSESLQTDTQMDPCDLNTFLGAVLDQEMTLPADDICSNRFFHGKVTRQTTENLLCRNGQFLVRESNSQPGQFVLSCLYKEAHLHFIIHEHESTEIGTQSKFSFDGALFDSVRDLIAYHVNSQQPITTISDSVIIEPVNRCLPLEAAKLEQCKTLFARKETRKLTLGVAQII